MDRRHFLGVMASTVAASKAEGLNLYARASQAAYPAKPHRIWIEDGIIDAGGSHEPAIFVERRGGQPLNYRELYAQSQGEEVIRLLKSQGVEVFHTHFYKGFGMAAELPGIQDTVRTAAIAHRNGMKIDAYVQWDTMMYETFFAEEPRAQHWIQVDAAGQPILLRYGFQQSFRYRPCFSNQEYLDYLKKVVRYAVEEVKADFIHFDNFDLNTEPESCHCDACKAGFRKRLRSKYAPEQLKERLGFTNVDYVIPPLWNRSNPPERLNTISDPVIQEWIDYRCQTMADALEQLALVIHTLNPDVAIEINPDGISGKNSPWYSGIDHPRLLKQTQVFWAETLTQPAYGEGERLTSTIRTYKLARAYRNIAFTFTDTEPALAECLSFNQTIGFAGQSPLSPEILKYIAFYRKHRELYLGTEDVAPVALLRSYASLAYHYAATGLSTLLVEQALIQANIPFRLIFDEHLATLTPDTCKALILSNSECLSDAQLEIVHRYVRAGGGLIATEQTGLYDTWRRVRPTPGLQGLVDHQVLGSAYENNIHGIWHAYDVSSIQAGTAATDGETSQKEVGRGRVAYLPAIQFDGPMPNAEPYFVMGAAFWRRPKNWRQVVDAVSWAARGSMPLKVTAPGYVIANLVEQSNKERKLLHLVNYNLKNAPSVADIQIACAAPTSKVVQAVKLYSPDADDSQSLRFTTQDGVVMFTVPYLRAYAVVEIG